MDSSFVLVSWGGQERRKNCFLLNVLTVSVDPRCCNFESFDSTKVIHANNPVTVAQCVVHETLGVFVVAAVTNARTDKQCEISCVYWKKRNIK